MALRGRVRDLLTSSTLASVLLGVSAAFAQSPAEIKRAAVAAAQTRQDQCASVRVVIEIVRQQGPSLDNVPKGLTTPPQPPPVMVNTFLLSGPWVRYEDNSYMRPFRSDNVGLQAKEISVYNGLIGKRYYPEMPGSVGDTLGFMVAKGPPRSLATPFLVPLLFHCRPRDPILASIEIDECEATGTRKTINDRPCTEFKIDFGGARELVLWLDTERGYVPVQVTRTTGTALVWQLDIGYTPNDVLGWRVADWKLERPYENAPVSDIHTAKVTTWERNPTVPNDAFELTFPPRTQVYDQETGQQYLVQEDGSFREISPKTGEYLDQEEPPPAKQPFPRYGYLVLLAGLGMFFLVLHLWRSRTTKA